MKLLALAPFWGALLAVGVFADEMITSLLKNNDDLFVPDYTQEELESAVKLPLNVSSLSDIVAYKTRFFVSPCKKIERVVLHPPPSHLFNSLYAGDVFLFNSTAFLAYKVVVDSIEGVPSFIRMDGFVDEGVTSSRYFVRTDDHWDMLSRRSFILKRILYGSHHTLDLYGYADDRADGNIVRQIDGRYGPITIYYPKFNDYLTEIVAGARTIWTFDPAKTELVLKVMTYKYKGNDFCVLRTIDWNGTITEELYLEDNYGYSHVGHLPRAELDAGRGSAGGDADEQQSPPKPREYVDPVVLVIKPPTTNDTLVAEYSDTLEAQYAEAKFITVNFRREPKKDIEEGWTLDTREYANGDIVRTFSAKRGYFIRRLVYHNRHLFEKPGYALRRGAHLVAHDGSEFLRLEGIDQGGKSYEYYYVKKNGNWVQIDRPVWDPSRNRRPLSSLFGMPTTLEAKDLTEEELAALPDAEGVECDTSKPADFAERTIVKGIITRTHYTALPGKVFQSFVDDGVEFVNPNGHYVSTEALHYQVQGLELLVYVAHDTKTGKSTLQYFMKNRGRWTNITEDAYTNNIARMISVAKDRHIDIENTLSALEDSGADAHAVDLGFVPYIPEDEDAPLSVPLNVPLQPIIDGHTGGYKLNCPSNTKVLDRCATSEHIRLNLRGYGDERCNIVALRTGEHHTRVIYKPADGYIFNSIIEWGRIIFEMPGYTVTACHLDEMPDKEQYFLQINAYDSEGNQHVFYYYKAHKFHNFQEISHGTYANLRYRNVIRADINVGNPGRRNKHVVKFESKHFDKIYSFIPRINVLIDVVRHGKSVIWKFDDRKPEIVTRVVTFVRQDIRGCLINFIDHKANEVERLYLNVDPKTKEYVLFLHKGDMFSLFKNYMRNRKVGFGLTARYLPNDIDWTEVVQPNTKDHEKCKRGVKLSKLLAEEESTDDVCVEDSENSAGDDADDYGISMGSGDNVESSTEGESTEATESEELTEEQLKMRATVEAKKKHQAQLEDNMYYSDKKFAMKQVIHKEGVVWDPDDNGDLCLDVRKYRRGQYRVVECEIMSPDGHVEVRYFMNTHNGRGDYREIIVSDMGSEI
ncbi:spherical body protein 3 [Babesia divergens]|uniref:Spherical body protein 3 n=1 Tax=Babesia divergens TaxID=32595 RepID=A0AAD9LIB1_BABDI|nr:spherical body protein 3 [Babesia divergens]